MKIFGPPTTKRRFSKIFAKLNRNTIFWWVVISRLTNIRYLVYWKGIICAKSDLPITNSVCEKAWFPIHGLSKILFFNFYLFRFSKFQKAIVKNFMEKVIPFYNGFWGFLWSSTTLTKIFDLHNFDNETTTSLNFFEISNEMYFVSLFFLNEINVATSLLIIHLKCTFVNYANLNLSPINKPYLQTNEYAISFFSISYLCLF